jgi:hypothetical protein
MYGWEWVVLMILSIEFIQIQPIEGFFEEFIMGIRNHIHPFQQVVFDNIGVIPKDSNFLVLPSLWICQRKVLDNSCKRSEGGIGGHSIIWNVFSWHHYFTRQWGILNLYVPKQVGTALRKWF